MPTTTVRKRPGRPKDRDFTTVTDQHVRLAKYVNSKSGLAPIDPSHIKAFLALGTDFRASAREVARREKAKAKRASKKVAAA